MSDAAGGDKAPEPATKGQEPATKAVPGRTLRGTLMLGGARVLAALPEAPLVAAADSIGELWYRAAPAKAAQARANLQRVCEGLAAQGRGPARARRAATDPEALERLVRACFRHATRYYLEVARAGSDTPEEALSRFRSYTPEAVLETLRSGKPIVVVGMHYAAIEVPLVYVSHVLGHSVVAPMETVSDPALQRWFVESRSRVGVDVVPLKDARRPMLRALKAGRSTGMVNDRDITHTGIPTKFFGHDAPISPGPALLAIEAGVPVYVGSARRLKGGLYAGKLFEVPTPQEGTRRERMVELTNRIARGFEDILADGPEQWWGAFHPIWPDLAIGGTDQATGRADAPEPKGPAA